MPYRIELGPAGNPDLTLLADDITSVDVQKPHTALSDFDAEVPFDRSMRDHVLKRCRIYAGSTLLWRGYMKELDWDQSRGITRINGPGIADDLRDSAIERSWTRTATHRAIQQVWDQDTGFDATVRDPTTQVIANGKTVIDLRTTADFQAALGDYVTATDPIYVQDDEVRLAQSSFHGHDTYGTGQIGSTDFSGQIDFQQDGEGYVERGYLGGQFGTSGDSITFQFDVNYTIPSDEVGVAFRYIPFDDNDDGAVDNLPQMEVSVDGNEVITFADGFGTFDPGRIRWQDFTNYDGPDLTPDDNSHRMRLEQTADSDDTYDEYWIGLMVVYDRRFSYNFDNSVENSGDGSNGTWNYLEGPELYPGTQDVRFNQVETDFNVVNIALTSTGWEAITGVTGGTLNQGTGFTVGGANGATVGPTLGGGKQGVAVSPDGGSTWYENRNDSDVTADIPSNVGATIDYRVTFDRWGEGQERTPNQGYRGQSISSLTVTYDGSDLSIIQDDTFRGSPFKILKDLHGRAGYRFAIDHAATDANGNLTKRVESFQTGTIQKAKDWTVVNRQPKLSFVKYANEVTVYGELKDDGTRPKVTVEDSDEVNEFGREPYFEVRPDLTTVDQVRSAAIDILNQKVPERDQKGTLSVLPTNILPGYDYPVDWFADGSRTNTPLERVAFSESADQMRGSLRFQRDEDVTATVIEQGRAIDVTRQGI